MKDKELLFVTTHCWFDTKSEKVKNYVCLYFSVCWHIQVQPQLQDDLALSSKMNIIVINASEV